MPQEHQQRIAGTIVRLVIEKGFGFVRDGGGHDYFFHRSAITDGVFEDLQQGDHVTFVAAVGAKGPRAESIIVGD
jgi:CspA family cold shock protein